MTPYENGLMTIPQCGKTLQIWTMAHLLIYIYYIHIHINFGPYTYIHYITLHTPISRWLLILSSSIAGLPNAWFDHLEEWNHPWPTTSWIGRWSLAHPHVLSFHVDDWPIRSTPLLHPVTLFEGFLVISTHSTKRIVADMANRFSSILSNVLIQNYHKLSCFPWD